MVSRSQQESEKGALTGQCRPFTHSCIHPFIHSASLEPSRPGPGYRNKGTHCAHGKLGLTHELCLHLPCHSHPIRCDYLSRCSPWGWPGLWLPSFHHSTVFFVQDAHVLKSPPEPTIPWLPSSCLSAPSCTRASIHHRQRTDQPPHTILPPRRTPEASAEPRATLLPTATAMGWNTIDVLSIFFLIKVTISLNASLFNNIIIIISMASGRVWLNWRTGEFMVFQHNNPEQRHASSWEQREAQFSLNSPGWEDLGRYT